jgi:hypothetical protein
MALQGMGGTGDCHAGLARQLRQQFGREQGHLLGQRRRRLALGMLLFGP